MLTIAELWDMDADDLLVPLWADLPEEEREAFRVFLEATADAIPIQ